MCLGGVYLSEQRGILNIAIMIAHLSTLDHFCIGTNPCGTLLSREGLKCKVRKVILTLPNGRQRMFSTVADSKKFAARGGHTLDQGELEACQRLFT